MVVTCKNFAGLRYSRIIISLSLYAQIKIYHRICKFKLIKIIHLDMSNFKKFENSCICGNSILGDKLAKGKTICFG